MEKVSFNSNVFQLSEHSTADRLLYCILVFWHLSDSLNILELFRNYAGFQRPVIELQELNTAEKKILSSWKKTAPETAGQPHIHWVLQEIGLIFPFFTLLLLSGGKSMKCSNSY